MERQPKPRDTAAEVCKWVFYGSMGTVVLLGAVKISEEANKPPQANTVVNGYSPTPTYRFQPPPNKTSGGYNQPSTPQPYTPKGSTFTPPTAETDPFFKDSDHDGVPDARDKLPGYDDNADWDGDGIPNNIDPHPFDPDYDNDHTIDGHDQNPNDPYISKRNDQAKQDQAAQDRRNEEKHQQAEHDANK